MNRISTKAVFAVAGCALALTWTTGGARAQNPADREAILARSPIKAPEVYKNIQVLQDMPASQIRPTMRFMAGSLGVGCGFCHEGREWDKDIKPQKDTARQMIQMMHAINKNQFDDRLQVTCFTCHRGKTEVYNLLPIISRAEPLEESSPASRRDADPALPSGAELFRKYVAALGGADAIQQITSRVQKGAVTVRRADRPAVTQAQVEIFTQSPDKLSFETHVEEPTNLLVNGQTGFFFIGEREPEELSLGEMDVARIENNLYLARRWEQDLSGLQALRTDKVDGREVYVVFGQTEDLQRIWFSFDKDSGLLLRILHYHPTRVGRIPAQIDYADYRDVDGVKVPFRWTVSQARGRQYEYQISQVQQNVSIEASQFEE